ncbi:E3 ubiquitin-protein ligase TRIM8b [Garra rufa]|uniref:E3 ubiquitin-protein ligase TRIM8b n=1 Tax=Garra rufa TaxID=137080 RepID=UPI003CCE91F8
MAENWKNCLEEELICPICLNVFSEPVQLPCKHNFCRMCINEAWSKDTGMVRCPECNHAYSQKPALEKNHKLSNIVEKFNALNVEKTPAVLHCILCRRGPPLQAQKVCLRCNAPCCHSHVQTHLQQPSSNAGHLLVDAEDVRAWSCPQHDEYRLYHCETEHVAVCQYCCFSRCATNHGHAVCDIEVRRNDIRQMLIKQQDRIEDRVQDIEEQLYKLESDKCLMEDKVQHLKEEVQLQYQKMQQLLEEDLGKTLEVLDKAHSKFCQENSAQALQLHQKQQEAKKLLSSIQMVFDKAEDIGFMKNTKSVKILMDRSQSYVGGTLSPYKVGSLNSKLFLSEISKREKNLCKMLEGMHEKIKEKMLVRGRVLPSERSNLSCHHVCRLPTYAGNVLFESGRMTGELVVMTGEAEKAALMSHGRDSGSDETSNDNAAIRCTSESAEMIPMIYGTVSRVEKLDCSVQEKEIRVGVGPFVSG